MRLGLESGPVIAERRYWAADECSSAAQRQLRRRSALRQPRGSPTSAPLRISDAPATQVDALAIATICTARIRPPRRPKLRVERLNYASRRLQQIQRSKMTGSRPKPIEQFILLRDNQLHRA